MAVKKRRNSILKNIRQNKKRYEMNRAIKRKVRASIKMAIKSIGEDKKKHSENISLAFKNIDKARKKGVFHKNKAKRLKEKVSKRAS